MCIFFARVLASRNKGRKLPEQINPQVSSPFWGVAILLSRLRHTKREVVINQKRANFIAFSIENYDVFFR